MTNKEALETLKFEIDEECHCGYISDEIHIAMAALEKQIPVKPVEVLLKGHLISLCPNCKKEFGNGIPLIQKFCDNCGQAFDWE